MRPGRTDGRHTSPSSQPSLNPRRLPPPPCPCQVSSAPSGPGHTPHWPPLPPAQPLTSPRLPPLLLSPFFPPSSLCPVNSCPPALPPHPPLLPLLASRRPNIFMKPSVTLPSLRHEDVPLLLATLPALPSPPLYLSTPHSSPHGHTSLPISALYTHLHSISPSGFSSFTRHSTLSHLHTHSFPLTTFTSSFQYTHTPSLPLPRDTLHSSPIPPINPQQQKQQQQQGAHLIHPHWHMRGCEQYARKSSVNKTKERDNEYGWEVVTIVITWSGRVICSA